MPCQDVDVASGIFCWLPVAQRDSMYSVAERALTLHVWHGMVSRSPNLK